MALILLNKRGLGKLFCIDYTFVAMDHPPLIDTQPPSAIPPPIGAAPENEDFSHPWIISGIVSALCFAVGFGLLYATRLWSNFWQWADWPFLMYCAILTPVLLGFYAYGVYRVVAKLLRKSPAHAKV